MEKTSRKILLTCALPYANGSIHLGHIFEHLYADFWTRFQKMRGHECLFLCADDTHGTPIMVEARKRKITPEQLIAHAYQDHVEDFKKFQVGHTFYSSTNSQANKELCEYFYQQLKSQNLIVTKSIQQLYCEHDKMFLPDRFVKGECPKCHAKDQYGDSCDVCSATYGPVDLINSYCAICSNPPVQKPSEQLMFRLEHFKSYLQEWLPQHLSSEMAKKMAEWFNEPLRDWDISRNSPYFGFQIPGYEDKYFYVWVDAPMGYVSTTKEYCEKAGISFDDYWKPTESKKSASEVYHLIGKDITYFHSLFWPALLKAAGFRSPTQVWVHGHVMVNGEKMSKSKGTFLSAKVYSNHLDPMYLRYYFASKFSSAVDDVDFNIEDFTQRTNAELIGKITNLASRGAQMLNSKMDSITSTPDQQGLTLIQKAQSMAEVIADLFENREFAKAMVEIRSLAEETNRYFDEKAPWKTLATDPAATKQVLTSTLNMFRIIAIYLKPILPEYVSQVEKLFNEKPYSWNDSQKILTNHKIQTYEHLATRIDPVKVKEMMEANKKELAERAALDAADKKTNAQTAMSPTTTSTTNEFIGIEDFGKIDLRVAEIISAEEIKEADKLLRIQVSLGPLGNRQIIAGIKSAYQAEKLVGRKVLVVANLAPRKMKFGVSEAMILAAGAGGNELFIFSPDNGAKAGDKAK